MTRRVAVGLGAVLLGAAAVTAGFIRSTATTDTLSSASEVEVMLTVIGESDLDLALGDPNGRRAVVRRGEPPVSKIPNCSVEIDYVHEVDEEEPGPPATTFMLRNPAGGSWYLEVAGSTGERLQVQVQRRPSETRPCGAEGYATASGDSIQVWSISWPSAGSSDDSCWVRIASLPSLPRGRFPTDSGAAD